MALLDDLATYLAAQSTAFTVLSGTGGNLVKGQALDATPAPDTLTALYDTAGFAPVHTFSTSTGQVTRDHTRPSFQALVRSTSYQTAQARAQTIFETFDGLAGVSLPTATGTLYRSIAAVQSPFFLQRDDNHRVIFSVNFQVER